MIRSRFTWAAFAASALSLEATALFFQHRLHMDPCVLCVYQRTAVAGLFLSALLGLLWPARRWLRGLAYGVWALSAGWGLYLAGTQAALQLGLGKPALDCTLDPNFPSWAKLDQWLPWMFQPTGYCDEVQWQFLGLTMAEWMVAIFAAYLVTLTLVLAMEVRLRKRGL